MGVFLVFRIRRSHLQIGGKVRSGYAYFRKGFVRLVYTHNLRLLFFQTLGDVCDPSWLAHGQFCYRKYSAYDWTNADNGCKAMEAELISIHSESDRRWLSSVNLGDSWIGLKKLKPYSQNNFEWTDGTPYDFSAWKDGSPNNGGDCSYLILIFFVAM